MKEEIRIGDTVKVVSRNTLINHYMGCGTVGVVVKFNALGCHMAMDVDFGNILPVRVSECDLKLIKRKQMKKSSTYYDMLMNGTWDIKKIEVIETIKNNKMNKLERLESLEVKVEGILNEIRELKKGEAVIKFDKNKWYRFCNNTIVYIKHIVNGNLVICGMTLTGWNNNLTINKDSFYYCGLKLATDEEVEEMLTEEANRRYATGDSVNSGFIADYTWCNNGVVFNNGHDSNIALFKDGKWAEITRETPEYTMTELIEKVGEEFKIKE